MRAPRTHRRDVGLPRALVWTLVVLIGCPGCKMDPRKIAGVLGLIGTAMAPRSTGRTPDVLATLPTSLFPTFPGLDPNQTHGPSSTDTGNGGLPSPWDTGRLPGNAADGALVLPIMRQGDGGREAAVRGCGPTSLLMATGHGDPSQIQGVLVQVCARPGGLIASKAVSWLRSNGYGNSRHYTGWNIEMLRQETMVSRRPVLVNYLSARTGNGHIVVVTGVTDRGVSVNDPGPGRRRVIGFSEFKSQWAGRNEYAIPVRN